MESESRITPSILLNLMGKTPTDNPEGLNTAVPWKSMWLGIQTRALFQYQQFLDGLIENSQFFDPIAMAANWQSAFIKVLLIEPIKAHARMTVRSGKELDI
jgi:hypothetical protein